MTFREYILELEKRFTKNPKFRWWRPIFDWISDDNREIRVDNIYRFENLEDDSKKILKRLGINESLPHHFKTVRKHYSYYYDPDLIEIVRKMYQKDIEYFNYKFEYK